MTGDNIISNLNLHATINTSCLKHFIKHQFWYLTMGIYFLIKLLILVEIPCPDKSEIAKVDVKKPSPPLVQKKNEAIKKSTQPALKKPSPVMNDKKNNDSSYTKIKKGNKPEQKSKILKQLEKDKIMVGQIIRIEQLLFDADSSNIKEGSFEVLNEIIPFLMIIQM